MARRHSMNAAAASRARAANAVVAVPCGLFVVGDSKRFELRSQG